MRPDGKIEACRSSHARLLADVAPLTHDALRSPSLLPGYTRAHVIVHITNKANAHIGLFIGAGVDEARRLHPLGYDPDGAADAGANRTPDDLRSELARALGALEAAWDSLDPGRWDHPGIMMAGPRTMAEIVGHHLRNVEVHHVDLDIGYHAGDWPASFIEGELAKRVSALPDRAEHAALLAWLLGRASAPQLAPW
jgi:maleylpyruvate isomerase